MKTLTTLNEPLGRFGHHPDEEIDWNIECEALENILSDLSMGHTGFGRDADYEALGERLARFLDFATLDPHKLALKNALREHVRKLGFTMSPKWYAGAPVVLFRDGAAIGGAA